MKEFIQSMLGKVGYEILRKDRPVAAPRTTMPQGIHWLKEHGFSITTVLDVGASDGRWTRDCMEDYPEAKYVLFEPQPVHSQALDDFAASTDGRVVPVKKAVGGEVGTMTFDISDPLGGGPVTDNSSAVMEVELTTIDATVTEHKLEAPFLLKLDTHGIEKSILQGADQTLEQCEILIIEAYNYRILPEALLFWELCAFLAEKGFRPIDLVDSMHRKYDNSFWQMDLIFIRSSWQGFDYVSYE